MLNAHVIATIPVIENAHDRPLGVAVDTFNRIYVLVSRTNQQSGGPTDKGHPGYLKIIDGATNTVTGHIDVGYDPRLAAVDTARGRLYSANRIDNTVSVIDTSTNTIVGAPLHVGAAPLGVAINPVLRRVYVANGGANTVSVIDGSDAPHVIATVQIGDASHPAATYPYYVAVNPKTHRVYTASFSGDRGSTISVIDGLTNTRIAVVPLHTRSLTVQPAPHGIAVNPSTNRVYVGCLAIAKVIVLEDLPGAQPTIIASIDVPGPCFAVRVDPATNMVWASCATHQIVLIDGETNQKLQLITVPSYSQDIAVDPGSHRAYVTNYSEGVISVLELIEG